MLIFTAGTALLAIVAVAVLIISSQRENSTEGQVVGAAQAKRELLGLPQQGSTVGSKKAKITLVEYGDLRCPACKLWFEQGYEPIIDRLVRPGLARFTFHDNAILGEESVLASRASVAAARQDKGQLFVDLFYRNQKNEAVPYVDEQFLTSLARAAGLDLARFKRDVASPQSALEVARLRREAERRGINSTPRFAIEIDGEQRVLPTGAGPEEVVATVEALARSGS